ncbi:unnamed protein product [Toxocara canis]|uniref:Uncharacterized protein n=1 Tax=Toxocara canis TaxID=6265 RepID=A0A183US95_TOXCA|nr:unnamed protein product [Toxocara canis]
MTPECQANETPRLSEHDVPDYETSTKKYSSLVGYSLQLLRKDGYMVRPFITVLLTVPKLKHKSADQICREKEGADRYRTVETDLCDIRCGSVDELQEHAIPEADAEHLRKMTIIRQDDLPANAAQQSMPSKDLLDDVTISLFLNAKLFRPCFSSPLKSFSLRLATSSFHSHPGGSRDGHCFCDVTCNCVCSRVGMCWLDGEDGEESGVVHECRV